MADTIKSSSELAVGLDYTDGEKTKTIFLKIPNPVPNPTESIIKTQVGNFIAQQIVNSPSGEQFSATSIGTAYTLDEEKIDIDIEG